MKSIFSKIIDREIPARIVAEDDDFIAFLDAFPLAAGHTLVVPKNQIDYVFDLEPSLLANFFKFAQRVALSMDKCGWGKRVGMAVIGLEVPHAHIHLVPINGVNDIDFSKIKPTFSDKDLDGFSDKISKNFV